MKIKDRKKVRIRAKIKKANKNFIPRIVVSRSNKNFYAQLICSKSGDVLASFSTKSKAFIEKKGENLNGISKAQIVGKHFADICAKSGIENVVFDRGSYRYTGRVKFFAESCRSSGLKF